MPKVHIPTDATVKECFLEGAAGDFIDVDFDAWLESVKAKVWAAGATAARQEDFLAEGFVETPNPHERSEVTR